MAPAISAGPEVEVGLIAPPSILAALVFDAAPLRVTASWGGRQLAVSATSRRR